MSVAEATKSSDLVMLLIPDENQADVYNNDIAPNLKKEDHHLVLLTDLTYI